MKDVIKFFQASPLGAKRFGILLSWLLCGLTLSLIDSLSVPWIDEVAASDTAVNLALNGKWISHCWDYSYNLLHLFVLTIWLKIFGVSHFTVCALNVFLAGIAGHVLLQLFYSWRWRLNLLVVTLFCILFWGGLRFSDIIMNGRIDILAFLCTILLVNEILQEKCRPLRVIVWSFLSMAAAVYQMPVVLCFAFLSRVIVRLSIRRNLRFALPVFILVGMAAAFFGACVIYLVQHQVLKFVHSYFSFNATLAGTSVPFLDRALIAYTQDLSFLCIWCVALLVAVQARAARQVCGYAVFILLIPLLQVCSGRCAVYYSWVSYVPVVVLLVYCVSLLNRAWCTASLVVASLILMVASGVSRWQSVSLDRSARAEYAAFLKKAERQLSCENWMIPSDLAYYELVGRGRYIWKDPGTVVTPREKFIRFANACSSDELVRQKLLNFYDKIQLSQPSMPTNRALIVLDTRLPRPTALEGVTSRCRLEEGPFRVEEVE